MRAYWLAIGMLLFGFLATASAQPSPQQRPQQHPMTPVQGQQDTIAPVPGQMNVIIQETPAPDIVPPEAMAPPPVTVRRVHQPAGGRGGKQAVVRHEKNKSESTVTEGDEIEGWKVISITDRLVTIEKKINDRRAIRAQMPVGGAVPIQDAETP
jgi:hypothetical protein